MCYQIQVCCYFHHLKIKFHGSKQLFLLLRSQSHPLFSTAEQPMLTMKADIESIKICYLPHIWASLQQICPSNFIMLIFFMYPMIFHDYLTSQSLISYYWISFGKNFLKVILQRIDGAENWFFSWILFNYSWSPFDASNWFLVSYYYLIQFLISSNQGQNI